jgi:predicted amidohydrolase
MRPTKPFRVRLAQTSPRLGDVEANLNTHLATIEQAAHDRADLLVFPELSLTGYYLRDLTTDVAMPADSPCLQPLARAARSLDVVFGMVEESDLFGFYASAVYLAAGARAHVHRKVYLPTYGMFDEGRYLSPGRDASAFDTRFGRMGLLICEDIWHPILPYVLSQQGMHYLIVTANSPSRGPVPGGLSIAQTYGDMLRTYARLFQVYVIFCNRVGYEDGVNFWGGSCVIDPEGNVIAQAPLLEAATLDVTIDPAEVRRSRVRAPLVEEEDLGLALRQLQKTADERPRH